MAKIKEFRRVKTTGVAPDPFKTLNQAYKEWERSYKEYKRTGSALAFFSADKAGKWYKNNGGTRKVVIPKRLKVEADPKKSRTFKSKRTGSLVTVLPKVKKKKTNKKSKRK